MPLELVYTLIPTTTKMKSFYNSDKNQSKTYFARNLEFSGHFGLRDGHKSILHPRIHTYRHQDDQNRPLGSQVIRLSIFKANGYYGVLGSVWGAV